MYLTFTVPKGTQTFRRGIGDNERIVALNFPITPFFVMVGKEDGIVVIEEAITETTHVMSLVLEDGTNVTLTEDGGFSIG